VAEGPTGAPSAGESPGEFPLRSLERKILLSAALILGGVAAAWAAGAARATVISGAACGAAVAWGNFFLIRKILERAFSGGGAVNKGFIVQYVLKFLGLVGIVFLVVWSGWFDVLGFLLGLTALFLGVLLEVLARSFRKAA
jgi:hypothetical protein